MSTSLIRTITGLSTNIKVVFDTNNNLYLDSIISNPELYSNRYQKYSFSKDKLYSDVVPLFFKDTTNETAFYIRNNSLNYAMSKDYGDQNDNLYCNTVSLVTNNKYDEEFEAFAPIYINKNKLPSDFLIFKIDGNNINTITKDNFNSTFKSKYKVIKNYDLSSNSQIGEWFRKSVSEIPNSPLYFSFNGDDFTYFNGLDIKSGLYVSLAEYTKNIINKDFTYFDLEQYIFNSFKNKGLAVANLLNFSFLFDDKSSNEWSFNNYFGMYIDEKISLKKYGLEFTDYKYNRDLFIVDNIIYSESNKVFLVQPKNDKNIFIQIDEKFYKVQRIINDVYQENMIINKGKYTYEEDSYESIANYKILSDVKFNIDVIDNSRLNNNFIKIINNQIIAPNLPILDNDKTYVMKIKDELHIIKYLYNNVVIFSDYKIDTDGSTIKFSSKNHSYNLDINKNDNLEIFSLVFTKIGDFDTSFINTEHSRFEYDLYNTIINSDEDKMYNREYMTNADGFVKENIINNKLVNIPVSSEYIASNELFSIDKERKILNNIWSKNPCRTKWGYSNSKSQYDYVYLLNNSIQSGTTNRTLNCDEPNPSLIDNNLSYFYSKNNLLEKYLFKSLDLEQDLNLVSYTQNTEYFELLLHRYVNLSNGIKPQVKWSVFNDNLNISTNDTLFRGVKFKLYDIASIDVNSDLSHVTNTNVSPTNNYVDYKFSIIGTNNKGCYVNGSYNSTVYNNQFDIVRIFEFNTQYFANEYIAYNGSIYIATVDVSVSQNDLPPNGNVLFKFIPDTIFWCPDNSYNIGDICNYEGKFYEFNNSTGVDFYSANITYAPDSYVMIEDKVYHTIGSNNTCPIYSDTWTLVDDISNLTFIWELVQLWQEDTIYNVDDYVIFNNNVYKLLNSYDGNQSPAENNIDWDLTYSFNYKLQIQNTVSVNNNDYINVKIINQTYYIYKDVIGFNNGIEIYVNQDNKTVLIHIYVNDNTINLELKRNDMYVINYYNYTIHNFLDSISNLNDDSFYNPLKYHAVRNKNVTSYSLFNNINNLPFYLTYDNITINNIKNTYTTLNYKLSESVINIKMVNRNYNDIDTINDYDMQEMYSTININKRKTLYDTHLKRYGGFYEPVIYSLDLFDHTQETFKINNRDFGLIKERLIQKVNHNDNLLKITDRAIYPILDEYGYSLRDVSIFNTRFNDNYFVITLPKLNNENTTSEKIIIEE